MGVVKSAEPVFGVRHTRTDRCTKGLIETRGHFERKSEPMDSILKRASPCDEWSQEIDALGTSFLSAKTVLTFHNEAIPAEEPFLEGRCALVIERSSAFVSSSSFIFGKCCPWICTQLLIPKLVMKKTTTQFVSLWCNAVAAQISAKLSTFNLDETLMCGNWRNCVTRCVDDAWSA